MPDLTTSTAATLSAVNITDLAFPDFIAPKDYEDVLQSLLARLNSECIQLTGQPYIFHEADPAHMVLQACAYEYWLAQQDYQTQVKNQTIAYAEGVWLDIIGADPRVKCQRLTIVPANPNATPPVAAVMESDADYRARMVLRNEGYTTAGSSGAYLYHTLSVDGDIRDASVQSPNPGEVLLTVLTWSNNGSASTSLVNKVQTAVSADTLRPLCDLVTAQAAQVETYSVSANITTYPGADIPDTLARAKAAIEARCALHFKLDHDINRSDLIAAGSVVGVQKLELLQPAIDLVTNASTARRCIAVTLNHAGVAL